MFPWRAGLWNICPILTVWSESKPVAAPLHPELGDRQDAKSSFRETFLLVFHLKDRGRISPRVPILQRSQLSVVENAL